MVTKPCIFCAIVRGEAPSHVVLDDEACLAFLDRTPLFKGHVLVVPRAHVLTLAELPAVRVAPFFARVQAISKRVLSSFQNPALGYAPTHGRRQP